MTPKEALSILEAILHLRRYLAQQASKIYQAITVAKTALEKQIPVKVNERLGLSKIHSSYNCPNCGCYFGIKQFMDLPFDSPGSESYKKKSHCCNCGQKLDWSDEK